MNTRHSRIGQMAASLLRMRATRFVIVGVSVAGLIFCLCWLFAWAGMPPFAASVSAFAIGVVVGYTSQQKWTFGGTSSHNRALPRYLTAQVGLALLSGAVGHFSVESLNVSPPVMSALVTITSSIASFLLSSLWVFKEHAPRAESQAGKTCH